MKIKHLAAIAALAIWCCQLHLPKVLAQSSPRTETLSGRIVISQYDTPARGTRIWIHEAKGNGD
jgi:hypothetical protein